MVQPCQKTKIVEGVMTEMPITTAEEKAQRDKVEHNAVVSEAESDLDTVSIDDLYNNIKGNPQMDLQDKGVIDSGCSRHMTGNMSYLTNYEEIDGGYVAFGGNPKGGKLYDNKGQHKWYTGLMVLQVTKASDNAGYARMVTELSKIIFCYFWTADPPFSQYPKSSLEYAYQTFSDD
ncbi:hypothetical protein Tco_0054535 [Tanacetum coccineum]